MPLPGRPAKETGRLAGGHFGGCSVRIPLHDRGVPPQVLEAVVLALLVMEHVDDEVDEVQQYPTACLVALRSNRSDPLALQLAGDLVGDGVDLAVGTARGDHEVVGDRDELADVEDDDSSALLRGGGPGGQSREVASVRHSAA